MDPLNPYATSPKSIILNLDKVAMQLPIGMQRAKMTIEDQLFFAEEAVVRLTAYVMSEHLAADTVTETTRIPAGWWQHIKWDLENWAWQHRRIGRPFAWWLRNHPPKKQTITLTATWTRKATRPMSTIRVRDNPALGAVVYQEEVDHRIRWEDI